MSRGNAPRFYGPVPLHYCSDILGGDLAERASPSLGSSCTARSFPKTMNEIFAAVKPKGSNRHVEMDWTLHFKRNQRSIRSIRSN